MTRQKKNPLRPFTEDEQHQLEQVARSTRTPAVQVERAQILLAVAAGKTYTEAARSVGRKSGDAVSQLVGRFNQEGLTALTPGHGGGFRIRYGAVERERILREARRIPNRAVDGTATWSLKMLQRVLRASPDGFPTISQGTILKVLHEAGFRFQRNGSWCETGVVLRKRKEGVVRVIDPETEAKKN